MANCSWCSNWRYTWSYIRTSGQYLCIGCIYIDLSNWNVSFDNKVYKETKV